MSKQNSPRWDAAFCGGTSGAILFSFVPKKDARFIWVKAFLKQNDKYMEGQGSASIT